MAAAPEVHVVVLAAGQGTRMKSRLPKVLHSLAGRPLVEHVLKTADAISPSTITLIVGHSADIVRSTIGSRPNLGFVVQEHDCPVGRLVAQPLDLGRQAVLQHPAVGRQVDLVAGVVSAALPPVLLALL